MIKGIYVVSFISMILIFFSFVYEVKKIIFSRYPDFKPPKPSFFEVLRSAGSMIFTCFCPVYNTIAIVILMAKHDEMLEDAVKRFEKTFILK